MPLSPSVAPYRPPSLEIVEQPADEYRFRYELECRTNGSIPGANSTKENKTYPKIKVINYVGPAIIRVSCVTKDQPYRPHPHKLVGLRVNSEGGVCTIQVDITAENPTVEIKNIGIKCMKKNECQASLQLRTNMGLDSLIAGSVPSTEQMDLHSVRLGFELLLPDDAGRCCVPGGRIVSDVITSNKNKLVIMHACPQFGSARGEDQIILLTEKLTSYNAVSVVFFEKATGWKALAEIIHVHKQYALVINPPPYSGPTKADCINVVFYLERSLTGDKAIDSNNKSKPISYQYIREHEPQNKCVSSLLDPDQGKLIQPKQDIKIEPDSPLIELNSPFLQENPVLYGEQVPKLEEPMSRPTEIFSESDWYHLTGPSNSCDYLEQAQQWLLQCPNIPALMQTPTSKGLSTQSHVPIAYSSGLGECVSQPPLTAQQPYMSPSPVHLQTTAHLGQFTPSYATKAHSSGLGQHVPQAPLTAQQIHMQTSALLEPRSLSQSINAQSSGSGQYAPQTSLKSQQHSCSHSYEPSAHFSGLGHRDPQPPLTVQQQYASPSPVHNILGPRSLSLSINAHSSGLGQYVPQTSQSYEPNAHFSGLEHRVPQPPLTAQQQYESSSPVHIPGPRSLSQSINAHSSGLGQYVPQTSLNAQQHSYSLSHEPNAHFSGLAQCALHMSFTKHQQQHSSILGQKSQNMSLGGHDALGENHSPMELLAGLGHGAQNAPDLLLHNNQQQMSDAEAMSAALPLPRGGVQSMELALSAELYSWPSIDDMEQSSSDSFGKLSIHDLKF